MRNREERAVLTKIQKLLLLFCFLTATSSGCSSITKCDEADTRDRCLRVLFIGNSYTFVNDLPAMFSQLAAAGEHRVEVGLVAHGGETLTGHLNSAETIDQLTASDWDFVVLQEQSQIPASEDARQKGMFPSARALVSRIRKAGATPILFLTWAHSDGWPEQGLSDYKTMQSQINVAYLGLARELNVPVAPVGIAWAAARIQQPRLQLWQGDGSHPSTQGTYLAACVFYAVLFHESPEGLRYHAGIAKETAESIQQIASNTVLENLSQWNLP